MSDRRRMSFVYTVPDGVDREALEDRITEAFMELVGCTCPDDPEACPARWDAISVPAHGDDV